MKTYHVTPKSNLPSILKNGLVPTIGERSQLLETIPKIYLFPSKENLETALLNWLGQEFEDLEEDLIILEIDLSDTIYQSEAFELTVSEIIKPDLILNVYDEFWKIIKI